MSMANYCHYYMTTYSAHLYYCVAQLRKCGSSSKCTVHPARILELLMSFTESRSLQKRNSQEVHVLEFLWHRKCLGLQYSIQSC